MVRQLVERTPKHPNSPETKSIFIEVSSRFKYKMSEFLGKQEDILLLASVSEKYSVFAKAK